MYSCSGSGPFLLLFCLLYTLNSASSLTIWNYTLRASSRRSDQCKYGSENCVCLGTENSRNTISVENNMDHYQRLKKSYIRCKRIIGNLEITHIDDKDLIRDRNRELADKSQAVNKSRGQRDQLVELSPKKPFYFLEHLEEVTGYILIFNVRVHELSLPNLKIVWGEKLHEGNALQIDSNDMTYLTMPSLRSIEAGNVTIKRSNALCYWDPNRNLVDYSEILGSDAANRVTVVGEFASECSAYASQRCHRSCGDACFGPRSDQCQTVYRRTCQSCESKSCYLDQQQTSRCCDDSCAGGCYGDGRDKCVACKNYEQDGKCVNECNGVYRYKSIAMEKELLPVGERRYTYGPGTLIEDKYCVVRCSAGNYRNTEKDDRTCVQCLDGTCPKVCRMTERINALNIHNFVNCSEIEGNIEILSHVFSPHWPDPAPGAKISANDQMIPALTAADLDVLLSVKIVTGFVVIDGGRKSHSGKPTTLSFLENLEMIEGRHLYFEKYSLYVIGNHDLKWLALKSLKKIKNGVVSFTQNQLLCYSYTVDFKSYLGVKDSVWKANKNTTECELERRKCDRNCDAALGCWGPGPKMCVRCMNFSRDGRCAETCPEQGYYIDPKSPQLCHQCHDQCLTCFGPLSTDCHLCKTHENWIRKESQISMELTADSIKGRKQCVSRCPNETFANGVRCELCHEACYEFGCTGPSNEFGSGGCNRCRFGVVDEETDKIKCLPGEDESSHLVCNSISGSYFAVVGNQNTSKYICRQCRKECSKCDGEGVSPPGCICAEYRLTDGISEANDVCVLNCGKGSYLIRNKSDEVDATGIRNDAAGSAGECRRCHPFCDDKYSCSGPESVNCDKCHFAGVHINDTSFECVEKCPEDMPHRYEGFCNEEDKQVLQNRKRNTIISAAIAAILLFGVVTAYLVYRCVNYRRKYEKEAQMHLPDIPPLDSSKITHRPNMRRLNLIAVDELDDSKNNILGQGAFGIVYAGKWQPPSRSGISIPVAIKAINPMESRHTTDAEMMKEAGLMASIQHEHLLPLVGICVGGNTKGGIKIITILRPLGSLLKFLDQHKQRLGSKNLMLYCYQISAAMEFLAKKKIVHRDLATRNVLVKNINHVEVTDFGLAQMLQAPIKLTVKSNLNNLGSETSVVIEGRVAVKWLAIESLRQQIYTEKTDIWSFGVTCWEILTFAQNTPYKELGLPRDHKLARELAYQLEKGYRLKQPANCSQELYQEMLNCWLVDPDSRPAFRQIKEKLELFCRVPHIYIQERQATQRMDSITSSDQRAMIEKLLQDSDFLDPVNIDPAEYALHSPMSGNRDGAGNFFSSNTLETVVPASPTTPTRPLMCGEQMRHGSTGTNSTRYKSDPVRKSRLSSTDESRISELEMDEENYLMPKAIGHSIIGKSIDEEDEAMDGDLDGGGILYTPVVSDGKQPQNGGETYSPTYLNDLNRENEYANDQEARGKHSNGLKSNLTLFSTQNKLKPLEEHPASVPYVNTPHQSETTI